MESKEGKIMAAEDCKVCKQCGRMRPISMFTQYAPKGKGIRNTTRGHWTICKDCEKINRDINRADKLPAEKRSLAQTQLLSLAPEYYKSLVDKGLEPQGAYARRLLNRPYVLHGKQKASSLDIMMKQVPGLDVPDHLEGTWGEVAISDDHVLPQTHSGDDTVKAKSPGKSAAVVRRHQDYKSFEDVERELKDLLSRIESGKFEGDVFDMDDAYTNIWTGANKDAFETEASAELKDLDATVSSVINTKMREE
jgi:hypothetical protein